MLLACEHTGKLSFPKEFNLALKLVVIRVRGRQQRSQIQRSWREESRMRSPASCPPATPHRSRSRASSMSSLDQLGLGSPSHYRGMVDFLEVVGVDYSCDIAIQYREKVMQQATVKSTVATVKIYHNYSFFLSGPS